jgi:mannose-1-phosphate guanylyltransferase/mannose-6-phosphate isomerase
MSEAASSRVTPVILSGGAGTRLWPLSRAGRPKQLLDLFGGGSMLAETARRVADPGLFEPPVVVAGADQAAAVEDAVPGLSQLILEPAPRNTAPAIALAARALAPDALMLVLPSDHLVRDGAGFRAAVARALPFARDGWIVTFGMKAERAETGYGYVERGAALAQGVYAAARFVEKPDAGTAEAYVLGGRHDWNAGMFLMRAGAYLDALAAHAPDMAAAAAAAMAAARTEMSPGAGGVRVHPDAAAFAASPAQSIDYAVMEKADRVALVPAAIGWSDIGSFEALHLASGKDEAGNAATGPGLAIDARGNLIRSDGPLVAAIGVEGLAIVATPEAVLVVPLAQSQRVREIVEALKAEGRGDLS